MEEGWFLYLNKIIPNNDVLKINTILYAGTLESRKRYRDLINSIVAVTQLYPECKLIFGVIEKLIKVLTLIRNFM